MAGMTDERWPALPYNDWKDAYAPLHMRTAVVRKVALALAPPVNRSWPIAMQVTSRGLASRALPREGPAFMRDAYSHEVISHGFWPGSGPVLEPAFYSYAVPEPPGLKEAPIRPDAAFYHRELGEFILPYEAVRTADDPDAAIE